QKTQARVRPGFLSLVHVKGMIAINEYRDSFGFPGSNGKTHPPALSALRVRILTNVPSPGRDARFGPEKGLCLAPKFRPRFDARSTFPIQS
ncbi:hypothetical protein, partial [Hydrogenibacillus schlegelii]|uniref:hypothetical protein n=1 Tax=Hydrogenibacillus schlegelii TaxID=1484 RepID=UPI0023527421